MRKREKRSPLQRAFLIAVGLVALALDKLEGKPTERQPVRSGRIEIVN
jgi:hypothetical protein